MMGLLQRWIPDLIPHRSCEHLSIRRIRNRRNREAGSGTLILSDVNSYSGGTYINEGTIKFYQWLSSAVE